MSRRDSPAASSESEQDSVSDSEVSETAVANHSSESEAEEDNVNLAAYYGKLDRVDDKEVTLSLHKRTIKLFFEKILGKGELDRDGRELLRDRYYMSPEQYKKLSAPDLLSTKLHLVKSLDFSGLSGMLGNLHSKQRDVSKVLLHVFETLVELAKEFEEFEKTEVLNDKGDIAEEFKVHGLAHYKTGDAVVPDYVDQTPEFTQENFDGLLAEARALRNRHGDVYGLYKKVLTMFVKSDGKALLGKETYMRTRDWVWDILQLAGQADVQLTKTRETKYEDFLQPGFKVEMKNRSKDPVKRREKFSSNQLFSGRLDKDVAEHSKDNKKVNILYLFCLLLHFHLFIDRQGDQVEHCQVWFWCHQAIYILRGWV